MAATSSPPVVGRAGERDAIAGALRALRARPGAVVAVEGEPGIGKSLLLAHLAASAAADGCAVLHARATEFEADLPYALWTEALDAHLAAAGERRLSRLGLADGRALGGVLPALTGLADARRQVTGTARTARCAISSSVSPAPARSFSAWTTSIGPIRHRSTPSRRWCAGRRARRSSSPSRRARDRLLPRWPRRSPPRRPRTA